MKALTLHQPWAHLIAKSAKRWETRSWKTNYRGLVAIHAAADTGTVDAVLVKVPGEDPKRPRYAFPFDRYLPADWGGLYGDICYGEIEAIVEIINCQPAELVESNLVRMAGDEGLPQAIRQSAEEEVLFGNFDAGRWAWELKLHVIVNGRGVGRVRGYQGLWNLPAKAELALRAACEASDIPWPKAQGAK